MPAPSEYDYTQGDPIPGTEPPALKAEDMEIGGDAVLDHDADASEAANSYHDLEPGNYLLRVTGFGDLKKVYKKTWINGQPVGYDAHQVAVRMIDPKSGGRIQSFFLLPPNDKQAVAYYNHGTNQAGKAEGFQAQIFGHFITRLIPGSYEKGKPLAPAARSLKNWIGREVWATVEAGKEDASNPRIDPRTGDPFPPRAQIKPFSFREHVPGEPCPLGNEGPKGDAPAKGDAGKGATPPANGRSSGQRDGSRSGSPAMAGAGAGVNGAAGHGHDNGLDDI